MISTTEIESLLSSALMQRTAGSQPTIIALSTDPTFFRPGARFVRKSTDPVSLANLLGHKTNWRAVGRVSRVLTPLFNNHPATMRNGGGWGGALLPYLTVFALDWAARLAGQMGAELSCSVKRDSVNAGFQSDYLACLNDATRALKATSQTTEALIHVLKCPPRGWRKSSAAAMLRIEPEANTAQVVWLSREGDEIERESLHRLTRRMSTDPKVMALLAQAEESEQRQEHHRAAGDRILQSVSPELAEAVADAREHDRHVGHRMFARKVRGLPAEVYLFVGPGPDTRRYVSATLVARRAHEDFVLGNRMGEFYYFPPVQLHATIEFTPSHPVWHVPLPTVRMPARQAPWIHPYTGSLHTERFAKAELAPKEATDAMQAVSEEARRIVPGLARQANGTALVGGMCLSAQDYQTAELVRQIRSDEAKGKEPNLFGLVRGLWNIVRVGLIRGHQNNLSTPIAELNSTQMLYRIPSPDSLTGTNLGRRTYPYSRGKKPV